MATGIVMCGQGGGVLILGPLLQTMIDAFGWQTTYRIMAGVVLFLCLSGLTYSPDVQIEGAENTSMEVKSKGCHIDVSVWKEPKFVSVVLSASIMMFGHYVPQIHLVNTHVNIENICTLCRVTTKVQIDISQISSGLMFGHLTLLSIDFYD